MAGLRKGMARFCAASRARFKGRRFSPPWWGTLAMLACTTLFIHLGQWQQGKAETRQALQARLDDRAQGSAVPLPAMPLADPAAIAALAYAPVTVRGRFEPERQFLVDNRIYREQAGYHVVTPLRIAGSETRVLVNRGWIPAMADHRELPAIAIPTEEITLTGTALPPADRFFTLGKDAPIVPDRPWPALWQNLDLARFRAAAPYPVQPLVLQLAADAPAGFARDWPRPDERWAMHFSYALQWYGFAASALLIWFFLGWRRP